MTARELARRMCAANGEDPDALGDVQLSGNRWSLSGLVHRTTYDRRPRWERYLRDARNALAAQPSRHGGTS